VELWRVVDEVWRLVNDAPPQPVGHDNAISALSTMCEAGSKTVGILTGSCCSLVISVQRFVFMTTMPASFNELQAHPRVPPPPQTSLRVRPA
jgi:hypothetical protein